MRPNIIYILADDMGYGDMRCNNADCRIPTPNLDRLAQRGMRFTDAHAGSSVCTPSRYTLMTGRYAWRSRLKRGIVWEWDGALIEPERMTVASLLRDQGYRTGCVGKWHLGWDWPTHDGRHPNETLPFGIISKEVGPTRTAFAEQIDFRKPVRGGPVDRGFDTYFGVDVPNFPPYTWFENDRLAELPTEPFPEGMYGHRGPAAPGWSLEKMIPEFTRRAVDLIEQHAATDDAGSDGKPLFLYFPLTSPHSPIVPNEPFKGMSGIDAYGDFVCEVDWVVGQVMAALERKGAAENTLLVFSSDNGPEIRTADGIGAYDRAREHGHYSMGDLRGVKRDAWEGGHRVPLLASWPRVVPAGAQCDQTVCLGDLMATCADLLDVQLPPDAGEDSVSMLPLLRGNTAAPTRQELVHHSMSGKFALRQGPWVYIEAPSGGDIVEPDWLREARGYQAHDQPGELFNLAEDRSEQRNRYADHPERVRDMAARLAEIKSAGPAAPAIRAGERLTE